MVSSGLGERAVDDGQRTGSLDVRDSIDAEVAAQFSRGHCHRTGFRHRSWRGLRECRRARGVKGDIAFDLLQRLVNVAV